MDFTGFFNPIKKSGRISLNWRRIKSLGFTAEFPII
jgi:hypothetical protein